MSSENQDSKVLLEKRLIRFLEDESRISTLSKLLDIVENGTFDSASSNIENFYSSYNDLTSKKQEIDEILDDVKKSQEQIDDVYNKIYDIDDDNIELKDSSSILNNLRQAGNDFATKKQEIDEILDDVKKSQEQIDDVYNKIYDIDDDNIELKDSSSILNNLRQASNDADKIRKTYINFYGQKDSEGNQTQGIVSKLESACSEIEESEDKINELKDFYEEVFNGITDDSDPKNNKKSWVGLLDEKKEYVNNMIEQGENDFKNLKNKINSLLPGATSAGLARAYMRQRRITEKKVEKWNRIFKWAIVIFAVAFLCYFISAICLETFGFVDFLKSLPLWVFSGFFIYYSTQQISEYKKTADEYRHKEALASSYIGFERLIVESGNMELRDKLLEIATDAIGVNPSDKINSNGQIPSLTFLEKIIDLLPYESLRKLYDKIGNSLNITKN
ncbi:hypothetical protein [Campylobacter concisus]|uniref:hypothetical protein n=1 Tax=Campylobacter concisus TaxID=199 RepID=UPI000D2F740D|nr:hypothetical protein [Campylobacter concisus]